MSEAQRSKRDFKEVVGVFLSKAQSQENISSEPAVKKTEPLATQVITFCSPFSDEETFALNLFFPTCLSSYFKFRYLATHFPSAEDLDFAVRYLRITKDKASAAFNQLQKLELAPGYFWIQWPGQRFFDESSTEKSQDLPKSTVELNGVLVVVDLLRSNVNGFDHTLRILDQLVLVIRPQIEDLKNAYKVIKTCHYVNREMVTSIIFNARMTQTEVEKVFGKFSEMVSEFLVLPVRCLGAMSFDYSSRKDLGISANQLNFDSMMLTQAGKSKFKTSSLEKLRFLQKLKTLVG